MYLFFHSIPSNFSSAHRSSCQLTRVCQSRLVCGAAAHRFTALGATGCKKGTVRPPTFCIAPTKRAEGTGRRVGAPAQAHLPAASRVLWPILAALGLRAAITMAPVL